MTINGDIPCAIPSRARVLTVSMFSMRSSSSSVSMLSFKGELSPNTAALLGLVEREAGALEEDVRLRKRLFNVVMECLQNLYHHNARIRAGASGPERTEEPQGSS